jgi:predicted O-methyltransferase YrrM
MKSIKHWTPFYIVSRIRVMFDHKLHPANPWLTRDAVRLLEQLLRPEDIALEFGSGRSTFWIARRVKKLTSVEHEAAWHGQGMQTLDREKLGNVELLHRALDVSEAEGMSAAYVRFLDSVPDASVDFCLVDGVYRGYCALGSLAKMKAGGLIVVDNAEFFLPSPSKSPGVRSPDAGPLDDAWRRFAKETEDWRRVWTTNGVWDTLLLFKP